MKRHDAAERGAAVVVALLAIALLGALAAVMIQTSSSEVLIAGSFAEQRSAVYAAEAIAVRALDELAGSADWSAPIAGTRSIALADGPPSGSRTLVDGSQIGLQEVVNMANCEKTAPCTVAELNEVSDHRPWATANPRWQLYAYGPLDRISPMDGVAQPWYVTLLVAADPLQSAATIALRAEAFGARSGHAIVELLAARPTGTESDEGPTSVNILSWREVR